MNLSISNGDIGVALDKTVGDVGVIRSCAGSRSVTLTTTKDITTSVPVVIRQTEAVGSTRRSHHTIFTTLDGNVGVLLHLAQLTAAVYITFNHGGVGNIDVSIA